MALYVVQVRCGEPGSPTEWQDVRRSDGTVYQYETEEEATRMARICYPDPLRRHRMGEEQTVRVWRKA